MASSPSFPKVREHHNLQNTEMEELKIMEVIKRGWE
ncbi:uncharacterized protein G2W53_001102 [Senna tora]|uniref:Uncharacterized protein n=1 Tax=Senna tora TaxID=362788 RepID=A0A834XFJ6_9FABA|nr:uncharacterized protein G2W53_001102 [Senna tora]